MRNSMNSNANEQIAEIEDFVDWLHFAATVSAPAFEAVWGNPEDEAYDAL
jgi:hypothetical protein